MIANCARYVLIGAAIAGTTGDHAKQHPVEIALQQLVS
jgi:hypothetical protein